jgi:hypothetical protein
VKKSRVSLFSGDRGGVDGFTTGVSLHGHTFHSREMLGIIPRTLRRITFQNWNREATRLDNGELDVSRLWWTPPLSPRQAWMIEKAQIEEQLDLRPMVSLTDHDNIEAPLVLRILDECRDVPVSVEWTAPYSGTFFHLGVHNLAWRRAREIFGDLQEYTARPQPERFAELLNALNDDPGVLVILNHPLWDEKGIGRKSHDAIAERLVREHRGRIHALELNGFRFAKENRRVTALADAYDLPVISGGDRHGREPNSNINLTNAGTFNEFVEEVRVDGRSEILWMPQYRDSIAIRVLRTVCDVVRDDPQHGLGWNRWSDRVFYRCDDGAARAVSEIWGDGRAPRVLSRMVASIQMLDRFLAHPWLRSAPRWSGPGEEEAGL